MSPKYLQAYVNEFAFRYAGLDDSATMFELMVERTGRLLSEAA